MFPRDNLTEQLQQIKEDLVDKIEWSKRNPDYVILETVFNDLIDTEEKPPRVDTVTLEKLYKAETKWDVFKLYVDNEITALTGKLVGENSEISLAIVILDGGDFIEQSLIKLAAYQSLHMGGNRPVTIKDLEKIFEDKTQYAKYVLDNCNLIIKNNESYSFVFESIEAYMFASYTFQETLKMCK